jgi:RNA polymerase sigma-70 factor (ECF subfamily)
VAALRPVDTPPEASPSQLPEQSGLGTMVAGAIRPLPPAQREVLVLRHYQQLPLADVARILNVPPTTARSRLVKALLALRERLGQLDVSLPGSERSS